MVATAAGLRIEGRALSLRPFTEADITPAYLSWLNDPVTTRYSNQRFATHTRESSLRYLQTFTGSPNLFLAVDAHDGRTVGTMTAYIAPAHGTADMGILIGERLVWGRGVGLDAWTTLMNWLLTERGLRKITAGAVACNAGMLRVMEKSGMHHEGSRARQEIVDGVAWDIMYFARFADA
jgi:ribosomal-protein-alanine N-acetyltransferase